MRTYGVLRLKENLDGVAEWEMSALEPHVAIRMKQLFPRVPKQSTGPFHFPNDTLHCADLDWFLSRYPLAMSQRDRKALTSGRKSFDRQQAEMERILLPDYVAPALMGLREGQAIRHYQSQAVELLRRRRSLLLGDEGGLGKAQPLTARVLTPSGWKEMGELRIGDQVIDPDGGTGSVTGVFDRGVRDSFRVTLSDGASTECCDEHLWLVQTDNDRFRKAERVLPLKEFMHRIVVKRASHGIRSRYFIPCGRVDFPVGDLDPLTIGSFPLDPYLLGVLIGDGCILKKMVRFSTADDEILDHVRNALPVGYEIIKYKGYDHCIASIARGRGNSLVDTMRDLSLAGRKSCEKFIPEAFLRTSPKNRLALLRGLMDTYGDCSPDGTSTFTTTSERLSAQVIDLVRSLGGMATIYRSSGNSYTHNGEKRKGLPSFRVNIRLRENPFRLKRKAIRWKPNILARAVRSVEPVGPKPMRCIAVSTKRNLYFTDDHIVTHNTYTAGAFLCSEPKALPAAVVCDPHMQRQWQDKLTTFTTLKVHLITKARPYDLPPADVYVFRISQIGGWVDMFETGFFKAVVYDEPQSLRTGDSTSKGGAASVLSRHALYRMGCTATPIYNYGIEMWNIMQFIDDSVLGSFSDFSREWVDHNGRIGDPKALGTYLREQCVMLRRLKEDVGLELPKVSRIIEYVDYDAKTVQSIEDLAHRLAIRATTGSFVERGQAARELDLMVRQATGLSKAKAVAQFVRLMVEAGESVLLVGWHRAVYDIWLHELADFRPAMYTGSETASQKEREKDRFLAGDTDVLIMSLRSGAGLDGLQHRCSVVVIGELDWSPGIHQQIIWRLDREGQESPVTAFFLVSEEGSDPPMMDVLGIKASEAQQIVDPHLGVRKTEDDMSNLQRLVDHYLEKGRKHEHGSGRKLDDGVEPAGCIVGQPIMDP
jgi:hypothetical protein